MTAPDPSAKSPGSSRRRLWPWLLIVPVAAAFASWWFTEPLTDHPTALPAHPAEVIPPAPAADAQVIWPEGRMDGEPAKKLLLASMIRSTARLERVTCYTATLEKRERMNGKLKPDEPLPPQSLQMKVRNRPFAIYLKFLPPHAPKEVVYAEGHHDNKLVAHNGDWTRKLIPRLAVEPRSSLALADTRHPVTEAGLLHLGHRLLAFREMDIGDPEATTVLDRCADPDGKPVLRSVHLHTNPNAHRPFARVEVFYDPETQFPIRISSYDWPRPGQTGDLELAEMYAYHDLVLGAPLTDIDFDPANPEYAFTRF